MRVPAARLLALPAIFNLIVSLSFAEPPASPPSGKVEFMPLEQVHAGMHGLAYTVLEATQPEPMQAEVLGVERDINGTRQDLILVKLIGPKPEYTGVVAGMSGSPLYIDGKLVGAISYRIG